MNFHDLCDREQCSAVERDALAWFLAMRRAREAYEELRPAPNWRERAQEAKR